MHKIIDFKPFKFSKFKIHKKSQVFTTDFFIAFSIFSVLLIVTMVYWENYNSKLDKSVESNLMIIKAFQISNVLVKNEGSPRNWSSDNVRLIGLAESDRVLSQEKVNSFINTPLNITKGIFQTHNLNFLFSLKSPDGDIINEYGDNMSSPKRSVSVRRYVLYNNKYAIVEFNMWEEG